MNQTELFEKRVAQWQRLWRWFGITMIILSTLAAIAWVALTLFSLLQMK